MTKTLLFVYGTLKREGSNHHLMDGCRFVGIARTGFFRILYTNGHFPMMVETDDLQASGVWGELYEVDEKTVQMLDRFEGHPNHFKRHSVDLSEIHLTNFPLSPEAVDSINRNTAQAYYYNRSVDGRTPLGSFFPV